MKKELKHLQTFEQNTDKNLNISGVMNSKLIKSANIMTDDEIEKVENVQKYNIENFKDIFEKIDEVSKLKFRNDDEKMGAIKSLNILKNYILNRGSN